ncbi:hypothetical protein GEV29_04065 [Aeromicrobium sp. SMF47]|uniref:Uncharacterized protein n=1 Tax=Aeromicrobium yanjiei TaxID=2662028 RepID=A0A5Q2MQG0_9ACTN|nr:MULTISPECIES: hypothetical protein [Aeromicrobium]MRJ75700.1 hypothetical protein [Aeromicrobium yanjiei]MRK00045.1 hypothetical protein [Aeromicrobium sp. S22]QGG43045.1 hypothetical protein GEV26_17590 [Aeromicrobium yanjiei]
MTTSRSLLLVPALALALVAVAGCSGSDDEPKGSKASESSSASDGPTADVDESAACKLLTAADRKKLAGSAVDIVVSSDAREGGSSQCRWQTPDALIQVTTLPAKRWATSLPDVVAQLEKSSADGSAADRKDLARAKKLLAGADDFTDAEACKAFVTLAEIGGAKKGSTTTITPVPITESDLGLSAQTCTGGHLTSVIYSVPGLKQTPKVERTVTSVLASAQKRVLAAS